MALTGAIQAARTAGTKALWWEGQSVALQRDRRMASGHTARKDLGGRKWVQTAQ